MPTRYPLSLALAATLALLAACGPKGADDAKVLATVNGETITEKDFDAYLRVRQGEPIADKDKERKVILDELVDRILLSQQAERAGIAADPETATRLKRVRENILIQELIRKTLQDSPIGDDEIKRRFQEEADKTHKTEYRVRHILVRGEDEARQIVDQLQRGASFAKLAREKSIDTESGRNGGELGAWINQGMVVPEFFEAVMKTRKGAYTETPVKTDYGWHVIKVEDTRPLKLPTVEQFMADAESKARLSRRIQDERITGLVKDLRAKARIGTP